MVIKEVEKRVRVLEDTINETITRSGDAVNQMDDVKGTTVQGAGVKPCNQFVDSLPYLVKDIAFWERGSNPAKTIKFFKDKRGDE